MTAIERERRIDFAANVILRHHRRTDQVDAICREYGIRWRQACEYLRHARARVLEATKRSKEEHLANAVDFYEAVVADPAVPIKDRLRARQLLDRAVGIGITQSVLVPVPAGPEKGRVESVVSDPRLADVVEAAVSWEPPKLALSPPEPVRAAGGAG